MKIDDFPEDVKLRIIPESGGSSFYRCLSCKAEFDIENLLYTCPACSDVLMLHDTMSSNTANIKGPLWRKIFDYRKMINLPALQGIYLFHEFIGPVIPLESVVYLGEGHTPCIEASDHLKEQTGLNFFFKNDGQNPSASFKDRGMASALSYINYLVTRKNKGNILSICASTGDTSAAAALYASYLKPSVQSAVLLPHKKVTPQQLIQPLGSGANVFEIPGVFDDCMKVVEYLSEHYNIALLNSKNAWRIKGQESYSYEIAQYFDYNLKNMVMVIPIGNAGNISAILNGFLKFYNAGIIDSLPDIIGVQSERANPVFKYYHETDLTKRTFKSVKVKPSVAQAAMIGNPVSMPRVISLVKQYCEIAGNDSIHFIEVNEQEIMDWNLRANRNGHIACTQGGESLAGLLKAKKLNLISNNKTAVVDSTAHSIKFSNFQQDYFENRLNSDYGIKSKTQLINQPEFIQSDKPSNDIDFFSDVALKIASKLDLIKKEIE